MTHEPAALTKFELELRELINRNSIENDSNTPDFILAKYLQNCLIAYQYAVNERDQWYGINPRPGSITLK